MTPVLKATVALTEVRQKLTAHLAVPEETRSEDLGLRDYEVDQLEVMAKDAELTAMPGWWNLSRSEKRNDAEGRELRSLMGRADVGEMFDKVLSHGIPDGPMAELQEHYGLEANQLPVHLLTRALDGASEQRAVTPGATDVGQNQQPVIPFVFPGGIAEFLGVDSPIVASGDAGLPGFDLSELSVEALAENAGGTETTGAFSASVLTPSRLQASRFSTRSRIQGAIQRHGSSPTRESQRWTQ